MTHLMINYSVSKNMSVTFKSSTSLVPFMTVVRKIHKKVSAAIVRKVKCLYYHKIKPI